MKTLTASQHQANQADTATLLRLAGAHAWTTDTVATHMERELAAAPPMSFLWPYIGRIHEAIARFFLGMVALSLLIFGATVVDLPYVGMVLPYMLLCLFSFWILLPFGDLVNIVGPAVWNTYPISDGRYHSKQRQGFEVLPSFVLELTSSIKRLLPQSRFEASVLEQGSVKLDPVLWHIDADGTRRPVLVWDGDTVINPPA